MLGNDFVGTCLGCGMHIRGRGFDAGSHSIADGVGNFIPRLVKASGASGIFFFACILPQLSPSAPPSFSPIVVRLKNSDTAINIRTG